MTYRQIATQVGVSHRSKQLDMALGEIVLRCHARRLPALPALVVRADTGIPGAGYYPVAHGLSLWPQRLAAALAWAHEVVNVRVTRYPPRI
jgi:hypothetical protein